MEPLLRAELIILVVVIGLIIIFTLRAEKMTIKYALFWLLFIGAMLIALMIPDLLTTISKFLGFEVLSNMIFLIGTLVLFCLTFFLTVIVSKQNNKIRLLIQEVSILKSKLNKNTYENKTKK